MNVAILAHELFPNRSKTAVGILRYGGYDVQAILDRDLAGDRVNDHLAGVQDAPIVASMDEIGDPIDALIIGIAPIGGGFDPSWRPDVITAIERGCDIYSGLHYLLEDDEEFVELASEHNVDLIDVRVPPDDLTVSDGVAKDIDADVVLTVGTDCSVGKMTATMELVPELRRQGVDACAIPTGQTGILIEGWGISVDRVISDFTAGAVESMLLERADEHDLLLVEGQGSIVHPAYSGVTLSILHGSMPDKIVLCHEANRTEVGGYEAFELPDLETIVSLYESLADPLSPTEVVATALNTHGLEKEEADAAIAEVEAELGIPCTDPVRYSATPIVEAIIQ